MSQQEFINMQHDPIIEAKQVSFYFDGRPIFQDLNFQLNRGEAYLLLGPSGSGKSLLLKILSGLFFVAQGSVKIAGIDLAKAAPQVLQELRVKMGFVFQDAALISNMCLYDNIALPLRYHTSISESEIKIKIAEQMAQLQIDRQGDFLLPAQLSMEMRKRAALARALILEPELLFLDEPTMGMGEEASLHIWQFLQAYRQKKKISVILVQTDWRSALPFADRIGFLKGGKIVCAGPKEQVKDRLAQISRPENSFFN
jgi:phospholipid/cholesterol/gamma-HCH transport system ATP-binding protein